jgi:RNA polymerase sigma-70 factor (ECF subfamily)
LVVEGERQDIEALLDGEESAFRALFTSLQPLMVALARRVVDRHDLAEEIAQETWVAVIRGLSGFGWRCRLESWILGILLKRARTYASRESRASDSQLLPLLR